MEKQNNVPPPPGVLSFGTMRVAAEEYTVHSDADFTQAVTAINAFRTAGTYRITLAADITAVELIFPVSEAEKTIVIQGDGSRRTIVNSGNAALVTVESGNVLVLDKNLILNGSGKVYSAVRINGGTLVMKDGSRIERAKASAVYVDDGAFTMFGGVISGNTVNDDYSGSGKVSANGGGGVYIDGRKSAFVMIGGKISGNTAIGGYSAGGGVDVRGSTFEMTGGEISGNTAHSGGGVSVRDGVFIMSGGEISRNEAYSSGGVSVKDGTFKMTGGKINGNTATGDYSNGGGVLVSGGTFTVFGGKISGNTARSGGGVLVWGAFEMSGGMIYGNTARFGGGVLVENMFAWNGKFIVNGGEISENTANFGGGVLVESGTFTKRGGGITGNRAENGKAVYVRISDSSFKKRDSDAGPGVDLDSGKSGSEGGWE